MSILLKNSALSICGEYIQAGEKANLALQMPDLYSCSPLYMPIKVLHSKREGPRLLIYSTLNGNEMNGLEIVNRLLQALDADSINGTIIAVPVVNVYGLTHYPKIMPSGSTLSDCFPGKADGRYGDRIAHIFTEELIKNSDYCIELHTGSLNHNILPQAYCDFSNLKARQLARAFQVPVVTNLNTSKNPLHRTVEGLNIPLVVFQAGEAMRFDENSIMSGVEGLKNSMRLIGMLPNEAPLESINPVFSRDEAWITAQKGGILHVEVMLGQTINRGDRIGTISDPFSSDFEEVVRATEDGVVVGINTTPLIHEGLSIFKIASFVDCIKAENAIETWEEQQRELAEQ